MKKFGELQIGDCFYCGGNWCIKKSTRTAWINRDKTLWFYFGQNESVSLILNDGVINLAH